MEKIEEYNILQSRPLIFFLVVVKWSWELYDDVDVKPLFNIWDLNTIFEENALLQVNENLTIALIITSVGRLFKIRDRHLWKSQSYLHRI